MPIGKGDAFLFVANGFRVTLPRTSPLPAAPPSSVHHGVVAGHGQTLVTRTPCAPNCSDTDPRCSSRAMCAFDALAAPFVRVPALRGVFHLLGRDFRVRTR